MRLKPHGIDRTATMASMKSSPKPVYFYLASQSSRRRRFLREMGFSFEIIPSAYRETHRGNPSPEKLVIRHARGKANRACLPERLTRTGRPLVLGADTVVFFRGRILGKPANLTEAKRMLLALSGRSHWVYSGICLRDPVTGKTAAGWDRTRVTFHKWPVSLIEEYLKRVHPLDKAGAYAIQCKPSIACAYEGSHSNVVGLPRTLLRRLLKAFP